MDIHIKYFGMLAEAVQTNEETVLFSGETISDLINFLVKKYAVLSEFDFQVAQNETIVSQSEKLTGAAIALLPPFSGG